MRLGWLGVEAPEVDDACQLRRLLADALHQPSHVIGIAGADAEAGRSALSELDAVRHLG